MNMEHGSKGWLIGTDTGGTFTDIVAVSDQGGVEIRKVPSTHPDTEIGVLQGVRATGVTLAETRNFYHATTVATNTAISRTGAKTALITTRGFRDVLELRRVDRDDLYDILWDPAEPLVRRRDRLEVDERIGYDGTVVEALQAEQVLELANLLRRREIESVAIVYLNSFRNPVHEQMTKEILLKELPGLLICTSFDILPEPPEYERTATTVANAYLAPSLSGYMSRLASATRAEGYTGKFVLVMHNAGGTMTTDYASGTPIRTLNSGPAGGAVAGAALARSRDISNAVCLDMGGTSADVSLILGGEPILTNETRAEWGLPVKFPALEVVSVGAGGGSIAWLDQAGILRVGPQSAGANPGPACYGKGGTLPTVTDAHLVLGHLGAQAPLGGELRLDANAATAAIETHICGPLGLGLVQAAEAIVKIADATMVRPLRLLTVERGYDPREFSLIAFGGSGPMRAVSLAEELEFLEVLIPPHPGVTSAIGVLSVPPVDDRSATIEEPLDGVTAEQISARFAEIEATARESLVGQGVDPSTVEITYAVDMRYVGQLHSLIIPLQSSTPEGLADARKLFDQHHDRQYRYSHPEWSVDLATIRVSARGPADTMEAPYSREAQSTNLPSYTRMVKFPELDEYMDTPVLNRGDLMPGTVVEGPAIIDQRDSAIVLPPSYRAECAESGELVIRR